MSKESDDLGAELAFRSSKFNAGEAGLSENV